MIVLIIIGYTIVGVVMLVAFLLVMHFMFSRTIAAFRSVFHR
jgi:hypothetical protein